MTRVFQRVVVAPALVASTILLLTTIPLWLLVAAVVSPIVPGRLRPLRLLSLAMLHLVLESVMLVELFGLWIASGFGAFEVKNALKTDAEVREEMETRKSN